MSKTATYAFRSRERSRKNRDPCLQVSRPRPRPLLSGLETETETCCWWTRGLSRLETMVSRSHDWFLFQNMTTTIKTRKTITPHRIGKISNRLQQPRRWSRLLWKSVGRSSSGGYCDHSSQITYHDWAKALPGVEFLQTSPHHATLPIIHEVQWCRCRNTPPRWRYT